MDGIFKQALPLKDGVYHGLEKLPALPLAQRSNFWPMTARLYEPLWRTYSLSLLTQGQFSVKEELALMLEWLEPGHGQTILDAACSAGLYARTLAHHAKVNIHAVDFSWPFLRQAKRYAMREGLELTLLQADVCALPYRDEVFDHIVCGGSLNEFLDLPKVIKELARVLKPGGNLWLMYLSESQSALGKSLQFLFRLSGIRFVDNTQLETYVRQHGLTTKKFKQYREVVMMLLEKSKS